MLTITVPLLTVKPPVCWLLAASVSVPGPALTRAPLVAAAPPLSVRLAAEEAMLMVPVPPLETVKLRSVVPPVPV